MAEQSIALLRVHAKHAPWNARGLAAHATTIVDRAGMRPTSAVARATLSARAVRFYVANGLLDRPDGRGTAATYGYRHLLQILAIKIRQREGQTLDVIKRELAQVTGDALERRVAAALGPALGTLPHAAAAVDAAPLEAALWRRVQVTPSVELQIRDDVARDDVITALREAVRDALGSRGMLE